jgi:hypothetical protein
MKNSIRTSNSPHQADWQHLKRTTTNTHPACHRHALNAVVLTAMMALFAAASPALADKKAKTEVIPPNVQAFGTTYSELAVAWWDWAVNQPPNMNPITDTTGAFCDVGQDQDFGQGKHIFFLAGNFGGAEQTVRHCTIPKGKALFFPIVNSLWIAPEECGTPECRQIANGEIDPVTLLECIIDGIPVSDLFAYRAQSPPGGSPVHIQSGGFLESLAPDFYVPRGYLPGSVADGYWILVDLDDANEHVIEFRAARGDPVPVFQLSVKYILTVAKDKK